MKKLIVCMMIGLGWMNLSYAAGDPAVGKVKAAVCSGCHGADGNSMIPSFPKLAGQGELYLLKQLIRRSRWCSKCATNDWYFNRPQ